jgi:hypothetical protein
MTVCNSANRICEVDNSIYTSSLLPFTRHSRTLSLFSHLQPFENIHSKTLNSFIAFICNVLLQREQNEVPTARSIRVLNGPTAYS